MERVRPVENPVAVVTGAAGDVGSLLVTQLLENNYRVAALDIREMEGASRGFPAANFSFHRVDVTSKADLERAAASVFAVWGRIDCLVNCAGIFEPQGFLELTEENWERTMAVNLDGTFYSCQAFAPYLISGGRGGRIVNLSSDIARKGSATGAHYAASKAAVEGLTHTLALELAPHGITVNAVAPGVVRSAMARRAVGEAELARRAAANPWGRVAGPEDVTEVVLYLLSPGSAFITGQIVHVNGGAVML